MKRISGFTANEISLGFLALFALTGFIVLKITAGSGASSTTAVPPTPAAIPLMGGAVQGKHLDLSAAVTTMAGSGVSGALDDTGKAVSFNEPAGITTDGSYLYVADTENHAVRKIR